jgi:hypothetical protein
MLCMKILYYILVNSEQWARKTGVVMKHLNFVDIYAMDDEV